MKRALGGSRYSVGALCAETPLYAVKVHLHPLLRTSAGVCTSASCFRSSLPFDGSCAYDSFARRFLMLLHVRLSETLTSPSRKYPASRLSTLDRADPSVVDEKERSCKLRGHFCGSVAGPEIETLEFVNIIAVLLRYPLWNHSHSNIFDPIHRRAWQRVVRIAMTTQIDTARKG